MLILLYSLGTELELGILPGYASPTPRRRKESASHVGYAHVTSFRIWGKFRYRLSQDWSTLDCVMTQRTSGGGFYCVCVGGGAEILGRKMGLTLVENKLLW